MAGVTAHVGERFLHDPVGSLVHFGRKRPLRAGHGYRHGEPGRPGACHQAVQLAEATAVAVLLAAQRAERRAQFPRGVRACLLDRQQRGRGILAALTGQVHRHASQPHDAFLAGLATAIGAGVSMAFSEGLSDTGDLTGRGSPYRRGAITGFGTFLGGVLHTLPFLIPQYRAAVLVALVVMAFELLTLAWIRRWLFGTGFLRSFISITLGGVIIATAGAALGAVG